MEKTVTALDDVTVYDSDDRKIWSRGVKKAPGEGRDRQINRRQKEQRLIKSQLKVDTPLQKKWTHFKGSAEKTLLSP